MNDQEWEKFFTLLQKISNLPMPWKEKKELIKEKALENDALDDFEEIAGWFVEEEK